MSDSDLQTFLTKVRVSIAFYIGERMFRLRNLEHSSTGKLPLHDVSLSPRALFSTRSGAFMVHCCCCCLHSPLRRTFWWRLEAAVPIAPYNILCVSVRPPYSFHYVVYPVIWQHNRVHLSIPIGEHWVGSCISSYFYIISQIFDLQPLHLQYRTA